jgi:hypothetical protein
MVLVDYLPDAATRKRAPVIAKNKTKEIKTQSINSTTVPRERKRPFLARALPVLVKKPWNWIKSIASKMD